MSPCTAKLSAYKSKHFMKWVPVLFLRFPSFDLSRGCVADGVLGCRAKPQSLFAKMEASKKAKGSEGVEGGKEGEVGGS